MDNLTSLKDLHTGLLKSHPTSPIAAMEIEDVTLLVSALIEILARLRANDAGEPSTATRIMSANEST